MPRNDELAELNHGHPMAQNISKLSMLIEYAPEKLDEMEQHLRLGATVATASAIIGVEVGTMRRWLKLGMKQRRGPYRILLQRVRAAIGQASLIAEASVRKCDPKWWLVHGPRRLLDDEWRESVNGRSDTDMVSSTPSHVSNSLTINISADTSDGAREVLENAGIKVPFLTHDGSSPTIGRSDDGVDDTDGCTSWPIFPNHVTREFILLGSESNQPRSKVPCEPIRVVSYGSRWDSVVSVLCHGIPL